MRHLTVLVKPASSLCNLRCAYCFYADVSRHREVPSYGLMTEDMLRLLIRRACDEATESVTFVFQGGEPMLAGLDFFRHAVAWQQEYARPGLAVYNTIQTNGTLIDGAWATFFAEHHFLVGVSLDGYRTLHDRYRRAADGSGTFDRVERAIALLRGHRVEFNVLCVLSRDAAADPVGVYEALRQYGYLQFIPLIDDFDGGEQSYSLRAETYGDFLIAAFDRYAADLKRNRYVSVRDFDSYIRMLMGAEPSTCAMRGRCGGYFTVESDGSVYPCDFYVTEAYRIGNIRDSSFSELAATDAARSFITSSVVRDAACETCEWFFLCRGGCRRHREPFPSRSRFCEAYRRFFRARYREMSEIAAALARQYRKP